MEAIAYLTDSHLGQRLTAATGINYIKDGTAHVGNLERVLNDISNRGIENIVFGGDIGAVAMNAWFFDIMRPFSLWMVLGNHDKHATVSQYYPGPANYIKEDDHFRYIILDTSDNKIDAPRLSFVKEMLQTEKEIILFIHHPVLEIRTAIEQLGAALAGRDALQVLLQQAPQKVTIFCGHYHMDDTIAIGNITQYCTPATSYQIVKDAAGVVLEKASFGYRIITIDGPSMTTALINF